MAATEARVTVRRRGASAVLDIAGDVDAGAEAALQRAFEEGERGSRGIVLNFARTEYVNSSGIALIVGLLGQARERGLAMTAYGLSEHYRTIFEITRLAEFVTIADDEDSAVAAAERGADA